MSNDRVISPSYFDHLEQRKARAAAESEKAKAASEVHRRLALAKDSFQLARPAANGTDEFTSTASRLCDLVDALATSRYGKRLDELPPGDDKDRERTIELYRLAKDRRNIPSIADDLRAIQAKGPDAFKWFQLWFFHYVMEEIETIPSTHCHAIRPSGSMSDRVACGDP